MAGISVFPVKLGLPSTPVQELIKSNGQQVPDRYVFHQKNESANNVYADGTALPYRDSAIVDLNLLLDPSSSQGLQELHKLRTALASWGCFQLINHGITSLLLNQLREAGKEFFGLPLVEKQKYSRTTDWIEGYGNDVVSEDQPISWNDRLQLRIHPINLRNFKFWPQNVPKFRDTLEEYSTELRTVVEVVLKAIARSLELEENIFLNHFGEDGTMFARFNCYPPCPTPERVLGLTPHSDGSLITILLQDREVEGLQVLKEDQWFKVPITPDALFINVSDQLEILSNGILKSPVHKVVIDKEKERLSVVVPSAPHPDREIGPLRELIDVDRPQLYKNITNYLATFLEHLAKGERGIHAVKI